MTILAWTIYALVSLGSAIQGYKEAARFIDVQIDKMEGRIGAPAAVHRARLVAAWQCAIIELLFWPRLIGMALVKSMSIDSDGKAR